jgi:putative peptide zinc metalloprotease protein
VTAAADPRAAAVTPASNGPDESAGTEGDRTLPSEEGQQPPESDGQQPSSQDGHSDADDIPPKLAPGTELVGEYEKSGLEDVPYIVNRADGQPVQLPKPLFLIAQQLDGTKSYTDIAQSVSQSYEKDLGPGDVKVLVEQKLAELGLLEGAGAPEPEVRKEDPLLALNLKTAVLPAWIVRAATTIFYPLFFPPVIIGVLGGLVALDIWLFVNHGVAQSFRHLLNQPATLLLVLAMMVVGTFFHEMGHATGCRYGGAKPGAVGVGIYLIWPAFYTDVNDAYRLGRGGRVRTDLGGVYFNSIFSLCVAGLYFLTGYEFLLLVVIGQHFQMLQQFMPFLRLDGYYLVADITGVPDLFGRIGPVLRSMIPGREMDPKVEELKPWVRNVVRVWVFTTIPIVLFVYVLMIFHVPRLISTGLKSFGQHSSSFADAMGSGDFTQAGTAVIQLAMLVLPTVGVVYVLSRTTKQMAVAGWRATSERPALRTAFAAGTLAVAAIAVIALWPDTDYRPIRPDERGTLFDATRTVARSTNPQPTATPEPSGEPTATPLLGGATSAPDDDPDADDPATVDDSSNTDTDGGAQVTPAPTAAATLAPTAAP